MQTSVFYKPVFVINFFYFCVYEAKYSFHFTVVRDACSYNLKARVKGFFFSFIGMLLPFVLAINFLASSSTRGTLVDLVGKDIATKIDIYTVSIEGSSQLFTLHG